MRGRSFIVYLWNFKLTFEALDSFVCLIDLGAKLANNHSDIRIKCKIDKGAPGFECRTGPGGGEAPEGLKNFTKVRLKFYFWSPMATGRCMGHWDRRSASLKGLSALYQAKKMKSIRHCVPPSNIIAQYSNGKDKGTNVYW